MSDGRAKEIRALPLDYYERRYEAEVLAPERSRKSNILEERKKLFRPIRRQELLEHESQYRQDLVRLSQERIAQRAGLEGARSIKSVKALKSQNYRRIIEREQQAQLNLVKEHRWKKALAEKRRQYGEYLKRVLKNDSNIERMQAEAFSIDAQSSAADGPPVRRHRTEAVEPGARKASGQAAAKRKATASDSNIKLPPLASTDRADLSGELAPHHHSESALRDDFGPLQSLNMRHIQSEYKAAFPNYFSKGLKAAGQPRLNFSKHPKKGSP